jgi:Ca2+/H+ antiporter, TMEM165/GDT1 family
MRLRRIRSPVLLLLLPTLAASLAVDKAKPGSVEHLAKDAAVSKELETAKDSATPPSQKPEVGTKDAPVDGLDGKPHAGPFVESTKKKPINSVEDLIGGSGKSLSQEVDEISGGKKDKMDGWQIPDKEPESVMEDRDRDAPKKGPTGTEGGISEKDKEQKKQSESGKKEMKKPEPPKEKIELPDSEVKDKASKEKAAKGGSKKEEEKEKKKGAVGLEVRSRLQWLLCNMRPKLLTSAQKPHDLPDKPHDIPLPVPEGGRTFEGSEPPAAKIPSDKSGISYTGVKSDEDSSLIHPFHSFVLSLTMIIFSEIGDKTFLIAALMAMRHARILVFTAAFSALITMTVLSAVLGHAVPTLLPVRFTNFAAAMLFLFFGVKLIREGLAMSPHEGVGEEMKEVEMELEEKEHVMARRRSRHGSTIAVSPYALESGRGRKSRSDSRLPAPARSPSSSPSPSRSPSPNSRGLRGQLWGLLNGLNNLFSLLLSPAWVQTFVMTFLGEWGDRSQIATIAMAAGQDYWWVTAGAVAGHGCCTAAAVIGGRAIAGRVSMRVGKLLCIRDYWDTRLT